MIAPVLARIGVPSFQNARRTRNVRRQRNINRSVGRADRLWPTGFELWALPPVGGAAFLTSSTAELPPTGIDESVGRAMDAVQQLVAHVSQRWPSALPSYSGEAALGAYISVLARVLHVLDNAAHAASAGLEGALTEALAALAAAPPTALGAAAAVIGLALAALAAVNRAIYLPAQRTGESLAAPETLPYKYDSAVLAAFYAKRPAEVAARAAAVASRVARLVTGLFLDARTGAWAANMPRRAKELREAITDLGPTYIKVGQAVSIRPDILPPPYLAELRLLQDRVPPFPAEEARPLIEAALGRPLESTYENAAAAFAAPVAAASLGQVYKARTLPGALGPSSPARVLAIKVQRPGMLSSVSLDLYIIRAALETVQTLPVDAATKDSCSGLVQVIDAWAGRFIEELDYVTEAKHAARFAQEMAAVPEVAGAVVVPACVPELTGRYTLATEWIDGIRIGDIDISTAEGKARAKGVQATLLNSYLVQLLGTGFLHADPHPGNFLLLDDGRVAILDFGLVTEITEDQRFALIEYIAHLSAKDYEATLGDLVKLDFIPAELESDPAKRAIVAPLLGKVLEQLSAGGGAKGLDVQTVSKQVDQLAEMYPLRIPSYFGLIVRAFSTLEGIGLTSDSAYSIVSGCFPYIAQRLLTDDSPRMQAALRTFVFGGVRGEARRTLKVARVIELADGLRTFADVMDPAGAKTAAPELPPSSTPTPASPLLSPAAESALKTLLRPEGNYLQTLLVDEAVKASDGFARGLAADAFELLTRGPRAQLTASLAPFQPLLAQFAPPNATGAAGPSGSSGLQGPNPVRLTEEDRDGIALAHSIFSAIAPQLPTPPAVLALMPQQGPLPHPPPSFEQLAGDVKAYSPLLPTVLPGLASIGGRYLSQLATRASARFAEDLGRRTE